MMGDVQKVPVAKDEDVIANQISPGGEPAVAPPSVEELLKALPDHIDYSFRPDARSDELVITLSASLIRHAMGETRFGRNVLLLTEKSINYYVLKADLVAKTLRDVAAHFSKVIFVGNSKGGYGGILLAGLCAQHDRRGSYYCMAFSPPTQLYPINENVRETKRLLSRMGGDEVLRSSVEQFGNLEFVQSLTNLHILLIYSEKLHWEVAEAARLCAPNIRKYPVPFSLHISNRLFTLRGYDRPEVERRMRQLYRGKVGNSDLKDVWPAEWDKAVDEIALNRWVPSIKTLLDEMVSVPLFGDKRARGDQPRKRMRVPDESRGEAVSLAAEVVAPLEETLSAAGETDVDRGIAEIVGQNFPNHEKPIMNATRFQDLAGWDSVGHVAMMLDVESKFGVTIPAEEMFDVLDVASLKKRILGV